MKSDQEPAIVDLVRGGSQDQSASQGRPNSSAQRRFGREEQVCSRERPSNSGVARRVRGGAG